jgi:Cdc6-like AAA superfamily ATPase
MLLGYSALLKMPFGPGRAASLLLRSRFRSFFNRDHVSIRTEQVQTLRDQLLKYESSWRPYVYWALTGPEGVGKTCLINTALQKMNSGVVKISFYTDKEVNQRAIIDQAMRELASPPFASSPPEESVQKE